MKQNDKNNTNIFNYIPKKYGSYVFDATTKYQKKYGFDIGTGEQATWNNEADAFKHTYMQAQLSLWAGKHISKALGDFHEFQGNKTMGQSKGEYNMDNWNNEQGREIAREIIQQYGILSTIPSQRINDIIAEKVVARMREGKLILSPNDSRKYENYKNRNHLNQTTGQAAPIEHIFTAQEIGKMTPEEFSQNEDKIMKQLSQGKIISDQHPNIKIEDYYPSVKIYTREEIGKMSPKEFEKHENEIMRQMQTYGIPYEHQLPKEQNTYGKEKQKDSSKTGQATSSDEGKWVTINGNHVLIKD